MGSFYVNFSVRADDPEEVAAILRDGGRRALVTSPNRHCPYCGVFDHEADSFAEEPIDWIGTRVSGACGPVLAVANCDSDSLNYWLFDRGRLVDRYSSTSNRFDANHRPAAMPGCSAGRSAGQGKLSRSRLPCGATTCMPITSTWRWQPPWAYTCTPWAGSTLMWFGWVASSCASRRTVYCGWDRMSSHPLPLTQAATDSRG